MMPSLVVTGPQIKEKDCENKYPSMKNSDIAGATVIDFADILSMCFQ